MQTKDQVLAALKEAVEDTFDTGKVNIYFDAPLLEGLVDIRNIVFCLVAKGIYSRVREIIANEVDIVIGVAKTLRFLRALDSRVRAELNEDLDELETFFISTLNRAGYDLATSMSGVLDPEHEEN